MRPSLSPLYGGELLDEGFRLRVRVIPQEGEDTRPVGVARVALPSFPLGDRTRTHPQALRHSLSREPEGEPPGAQVVAHGLRLGRAAV